MAQVGLKNFYYAKLTKDDETGVTYEEPKRVYGLNSIDINPTVNKANLFGDDSAIATASSLGEIEVTIDIADIPLDDLAILLGSESSSDTSVVTTDTSTATGLATDTALMSMLSKGTDSAPYVAIMFESEKHDGATRYVKLLKGKFSVSQETTNTKGDSIEYQIPQLSGTFVTRKFDSAWKFTADSKDSALGKVWYASVGNKTAS